MNKMTLRESLCVFGKALRASLKARRPVSLVVAVLGIAAAFLPVLIATQLERFTDCIQNAFGAGTEAVSGVLLSFAVLAMLYLIKLIYEALQEYYRQVDTQDVLKYIKEFILRCVCTVQYKYIESFDDFKEKINFANTDAGKRVAQSVQSVLLWIQQLVTFGSLAVVLWQVHYGIVLILVGTCIPAAVLAYFQKDEDYRRRTKWMKEGTFIIFYFHDACAQHTLNEVRFFGIFDYIKNELWKKTFDVYTQKKNEITRKHVLFNSVADLLRGSAYLVVLLLTVAEIFSDPARGLGTFTMVLAMAADLQAATTKLLVAVAQFGSDLGYMRDFFALEELEHEKLDQNALPYENAEIQFDHVSFSYPGTARPVLKDLNITIHPGEKVAIVGENGSGKTTFVNLLCGMYAPDKGAITIGGKNTLEDLSRTRRTISAVFQDFGRYEATIRENVTISAPERKAAPETLEHLSEQTGLAAFAGAQPDGYDEMIGSFSEAGANLSGGQWQKIAITRALWREQAKIMILDEPTAALDPIAEASLYENFADMTGDRTTVLISHRLGVAKIVDRILVFDGGKIIEDGSHQELMALDGKYAQMYRAQAEFYQ